MIAITLGGEVKQTPAGGKISWWWRVRDGAELIGEGGGVTVGRGFKSEIYEWEALESCLRWLDCLQFGGKDVIVYCSPDVAEPLSGQTNGDLGVMIAYRNSCLGLLKRIAKANGCHWRTEAAGLRHHTKRVRTDKGGRPPGTHGGRPNGRGAT